MKYCIACTMPMDKKEDFGGQNETCETCTHCTNDNGTVKSCEEIFEGGVTFFMQATQSDRELSEKLVRKNMGNLPYWKTQKRSCLEGNIATDKEFSDALKKLGDI